MTGIELIALERARQISGEDYSAEHDAEHGDGCLANAAACYALSPAMRTHVKTAPHHQEWTGAARYDDSQLINVGKSTVPAAWPWNGADWKPGDRVRELVKAGALIAAEIDRLTRAEAKPKWKPCSRCTSHDYCTNSLRGCDIDEMSR